MVDRPSQVFIKAEIKKVTDTKTSYEACMKIENELERLTKLKEQKIQEFIEKSARQLALDDEVLVPNPGIPEPSFLDTIKRLIWS